MCVSARSIVTVFVGGQAVVCVRLLVCLFGWVTGWLIVCVCVVCR